jgi:hypothetical protein
MERANADTKQRAKSSTLDEAGYRPFATRTCGIRVRDVCNFFFISRGLPPFQPPENWTPQPTGTFLPMGRTGRGPSRTHQSQDETEHNSILAGHSSLCLGQLAKLPVFESAQAERGNADE